MPFSTAILSYKTQETHEALLCIVADLNENINPLTIKSDFEHDPIKAFSKKFPFARISGCHFYLGKCLIGKAE